MHRASSNKRHLSSPSVAMFVFISNREQFTHKVETCAEWTLLGSQAGKFRYKLGDNGEKGICLPGEFILCPPDVPLHRATLEKMNFYLCRFLGEPPALPKGLHKWPGRHSPRDAVRLGSTLAHLQALQNESDRPGAAAWRDHLLADLLNQCAYELQNPVARETEQPDRLMLKISEHLQADLATTRPLHEIARDFRISPFQLSRRFHSTFGVSPALYRTRLRMKHACNLLLETTWTMERIAAGCGFENAFYFSRVFSRQMGQPSGGFRKNARF